MDELTKHDDFYLQVCNAEIESLRQQLATAQDALENEQAKGIHPCHANCTMDGCVNRKLREQLAAALAAIKAKDGALQSAISAHGYESGDLHDALAIQPDGIALKKGLDQAWCRDPDQ